MQKILRNTIIGLTLLVPFITINVSESLLFPFITGKNFLFRILVMVMAALYVGLVFSNKEFKPKKDLLSIVVFTFSIIVLVADIFAVNFNRSFWSNFERMEGFVTILHVALYFFVASNVLRKRSDWNLFFFSSVAVSTYLSGYGLLQIFKVIEINQGGVRVDGTLGNAAYFSGFLIFSIFTILFLLLRNSEIKKGIVNSINIGLALFIVKSLFLIKSGASFSGSSKLLIGTAFVLIVFSALWRFVIKKDENILSLFLGLILFITELSLLYLSATRGSMIGFIGGIFVASIFVLIFEKKSKVLRNIAIYTTAGIVIIVGSFIVFKDAEFVKNSPVLSRFAAISWNETKSQARSYTWPMALQGFKENPVLGWGQEGFIYVFTKYYNPKMATHEPWFDRTHNIFLEWLVSAGIFGFLAYISIYVSAVYVVFKSKKLSPEEKGLIFGLIVAHSFHGLFIFDNIVSYIFFFSFLAFISTNAKEKEDENIKIGNDINIGGVATSIIIGIALIYFFNKGPYFQNKDIISAGTTGKIQELIDATKSHPLGALEGRDFLVRISSQVNQLSGIKQEIKDNFSAVSVQSFNDQIKEDPNDARSFLIIGTYLNSIGKSEAAIPYLEKGRDLSPEKQQTLIQLGTAYLGIGKISEGMEVLKKAHELFTDYDFARVVYISALLETNKTKEAVGLVDGVRSYSNLVDEQIIGNLTIKGFSDKAKEILEKAILENNKNEKAYVLLAKVYLAKGNKTKMLEVMEKLKVERPDLESVINEDIKTFSNFKI